MASGKQQLEINAQLKAWWVAVSHDPNFDQILVLARAELCETSTGWDALKGGNAAFDMLLHFTDSDDLPSMPLSSGIDHHFNEPPKGLPKVLPKKE